MGINDTLMIITIPIAVIAIIYIFIKSNKNKNEYTGYQPINQYHQIANVNSICSLYSSKYEKKQLLTITEQYFYNSIEPICKKNNIKICPKVRMEDFVKVKAIGKEYNYYRNMIKGRHIDFLLTDNNLNIIAALELDDYTHNYAKNIKTDQFKNGLYLAIGITLHRIKVGSNYTEQIKNILRFYGYSN